MASILPDAPPTLFVAMADGNVVTFTFDPEQNTLRGSNRIILGSEPVSFKKLPGGNGQSNVFATCEQPSLIYGSEGRVIYSAVNTDKSSRVCHFNSTAYPGAVAIATPRELKLAMIDRERTTQIQTLHVDETVRALTYATSHKAFGLGCIRRILEGGEEGLLSSFKIADEVTFKELDAYELNDGELVECVITTGPGDEEDQHDHGEMFVMGTSVLEETSEGSVRGRILFFEISRDRKIKLAAEHKVKGACRSLAMLPDGKLVAGLVKTVVVYAVAPQPPSLTNLHLVKLASYRTATNPLSISVTSSAPQVCNGKSPVDSYIIAVADLMKSVSILHYRSSPPSTGEPDQLVEVARHFATLWSSAITSISSNEWLLADMEGNLLLLRRNENGVTEDDRRRLEVTSEMLLGEVVNSIVPIHKSTSLSTEPKSSLTTSTTSSSQNHNILSTPVTPIAFLATTEGAIYLFATIKPAYQDLLMRLQNAIAARVKAPGHMPWSKYRAFKSEVREADEPFRFVDGELLERFLDLDEETDMNGIVAEVLAGGLPTLEKKRRDGTNDNDNDDDDDEEQEGEEKDKDKKQSRGNEQWSVSGIKALVEGLRRLH